MSGQQFCCVSKVLVFVVICILIYKIEAKTTTFNSTSCTKNCDFWNNQYWNNGVPGNNDTVIINGKANTTTIKMQNQPVNFTNFYSLSISNAALEIKNNPTFSITHELNVNNNGFLNLTYVNLNIGSFIINNADVYIREKAVVTAASLNATVANLLVGEISVTYDVEWEGGSLTVIGTTFFGGDSYFHNGGGSVTFGYLKSSIQPSQRGPILYIVEQKKMDFLENVDLEDVRLFAFINFLRKPTSIQFSKSLYLPTKYLTEYPLAGFKGFKMVGDITVNVTNDLISSSKVVLSILNERTAPTLKVGGKFIQTKHYLHLSRLSEIVLTGNNSLILDNNATICGSGTLIGNLEINQVTVRDCYDDIDHPWFFSHLKVEGDVTFSKNAICTTRVGSDEMHSTLTSTKDIYLGDASYYVYGTTPNGTITSTAIQGKNIYGSFSKVTSSSNLHIKPHYYESEVKFTWSSYPIYDLAPLTPTLAPPYTPYPFPWEPSYIPPTVVVTDQWYFWVGMVVGLIIIIAIMVVVIRKCRARTMSQVEVY